MSEVILPRPPRPTSPPSPTPTSPCSPTPPALGQEDPRQAALLRPVGRPRRRPGEVPGAEGRPARRPQAPARTPTALTVKDAGQRLPERQAGPGGRRRAVAADVGRLQASVRPAGRPLRQGAGWSPTWPRRLRRAAEQDGEEVGAAPAGQRLIQYIRCRVQARLRRRPDRPARPLRPGFKRPSQEDAAPAPGRAGAEAVHGRGNPPPARRRRRAAEGDDPAGHQLRLRQRRLRQPAAGRPRPGRAAGSTSRGRRPASPAAARSGRRPSRRSGKRWRSGRSRRTRTTPGWCSSRSTGGRWAQGHDATTRVSQEMRQAARRSWASTAGRGSGFYTLRHTFRTVADEAKDQPAADFIMGHEVAHMSSVYRESISDERLRAVSDHVRGWLFAAAAAQPPAQLPQTQNRRNKFRRLPRGGRVAQASSRSGGVASINSIGRAGVNRPLPGRCSSYPLRRPAGSSPARG